jgi:hypothetical protein
MKTPITQELDVIVFIYVCVQNISWDLTFFQVIDNRKLAAVKGLDDASL